MSTFDALLFAWYTELFVTCYYVACRLFAPCAELSLSLLWISFFGSFVFCGDFAVRAWIASFFADTSFGLGICFLRCCYFFCFEFLALDLLRFAGDFGFVRGLPVSL